MCFEKTTIKNRNKTIKKRNIKIVSSTKHFATPLQYFYGPPGGPTGGPPGGPPVEDLWFRHLVGSVIESERVGKVGLLKEGGEVVCCQDGGRGWGKWVKKGGEICGDLRQSLFRK